MPLIAGNTVFNMQLNLMKNKSSRLSRLAALHSTVPKYQFWLLTKINWDIFFLAKLLLMVSTSDLDSKWTQRF